MSSGNWLEARLAFLTDPLKEVYALVAALDHNHQDALKTFHDTVAGLTSGPAAFQGSAATSMLELTASYHQTERQLSGSATGGSTGAGTTMTALGSAAHLLAVAVLDAEIPLETAVLAEAPEAAEDVALLAVSAAQGGLDPVTDAGAGWLTGKLMVQIGGAITLFLGALTLAYVLWKNQMDALASQPLPHLPHKPEAPKDQISGEYAKVNVPTYHALTQQDGQDIDEILKQYGDVDRSLIEDLFKLGYTKDEIKKILRALIQNKSSVKGRSTREKYLRSLNGGLAAIIRSITEGMKSDDYQKLKEQKFSDQDLRNILAASDLSLPDVLKAAENANKNGLYQKLQDAGLSDTEINAMLGSMTKDEQGNTGKLDRLEAVLERLQQAQADGIDQQGLTSQQLHSLLFGEDGIISALLSGDDNRRQEGKVAAGIIEDVIGFNTQYGPDGSVAQVDIETTDYLIEVKKPDVARVYQKQIERLLNNSTVNPKKKKVIIYAPGYAGNTYGATLIDAINKLRKALGLSN